MPRPSGSHFATILKHMHSELTNLLPFERQRELSRDYILRFAAAVATALTALVVVAGLLLVPTYVLLTQRTVSKGVHLANIESILSSSNEGALSARLAALSNDAKILTALGSVPSASAIIRSMLATPRPGISLSGFSYSPAEAASSAGTLSISGSAATRDALRAYQLAIEDSAFATSADLPVSAYARDANIPFTITVTLAP